MKNPENLFMNPLTIDDVEAMFKSISQRALNLFGDSCCIDTEPPHPFAEPGIKTSLVQN